MEIKALLRQYTFSVIVILCTALLLCGIILVREKTQYNMDMTDYDKVEFSRTESGVVITAGERIIELEKSDFDFFK